MRVQRLGWFSRGALAAAIATTASCGGEGTSGSGVTSLRIQPLPATVVAGDLFTAVVELLGSNGQVRAGASGEVTLALLNPGTRVLAGPTTVSAIDGVATFPGLSITQSGTGLQVVAASAGLTTSSAAFQIRAGPPSLDESTVSPAPGNVPPNTDVDFSFVFADAFNNPVANATVLITSTLAGSTFTPATGTTTATGGFATKLNSTNTGSATVTATVGGAPIQVATPYVVVDLCPTPLALALPGSVNGVQPCGAYASGVVAPSVYQFTTAGGGVAVTITAPFRPLFQVKLNSTSNDISLTPPDPLPAPPWTTEWLLPAGTYLYRISSLTAPGSFSLQTASVPGNTGQIDRYLVAPATYTGQTLDVNDSQFGDGSRYDLFFFRSSAACTVTLQSSVFRPYLAVLDAITGAPLAADVTTPIGVDAVISLPTCRAAPNNPIVIITNGFAASDIGAYTLVLGVTGGALRAGAPFAQAGASVSVNTGVVRELIRRAALRK